MDQQKMFQCQDDDFMVHGKDEQEIMEIARKHMKDKHDMDVTDEELMQKITSSES